MYLFQKNIEVTYKITRILYLNPARFHNVGTREQKINGEGV